MGCIEKIKSCCGIRMTVAWVLWLLLCKRVGGLRRVGDGGVRKSLCMIQESVAEMETNLLGECYQLLKMLLVSYFVTFIYAQFFCSISLLSFIFPPSMFHIVAVCSVLSAVSAWIVQPRQSN